MFSDRLCETPEQSSPPSKESIVDVSKKGEGERGAMGGRRSRPLGSVGNIHWKEKLVYSDRLIDFWQRGEKKSYNLRLRVSCSAKLTCLQPPNHPPYQWPESINHHHQRIIIITGNMRDCRSRDDDHHHNLHHKYNPEMQGNEWEYANGYDEKMIDDDNQPTVIIIIFESGHPSQIDNIPISHCIPPWMRPCEAFRLVWLGHIWSGKPAKGGWISLYQPAGGGHSHKRRLKNRW